MNKRLVVLLVLLGALLALSSVVVLAVGLDDAGNPNDPTVNDSANECYEGGVMEGKCDTEIEWLAGWYLIKYRYGLIETVPSWAVWSLPENYIAEVVVAESDPGTPPPAPAGCIGPVNLPNGPGGSSGAGKYILFDTGVVEAGTDPYTAAGCNSGQEWFYVIYTLVYAPGGQSEADSLCGGTGVSVGSDVYKCN
jgi:hypothetical protein